MSLYVGPGIRNNSKVFFEFSIYSNFYEIFCEPFMLNKNIQMEKVFILLFLVCAKLLQRLFLNLNTHFGLYCKQFYFIQRNVTSTFTYALEDLFNYGAMHSKYMLTLSE